MKNKTKLTLLFRSLYASFQFVNVIPFFKVLSAFLRCMEMRTPCTCRCSFIKYPLLVVPSLAGRGLRSATCLSESANESVRLLPMPQPPTLAGYRAARVCSYHSFSNSSTLCSGSSSLYYDRSSPGGETLKEVDVESSEAGERRCRCIRSGSQSGVSCASPVGADHSADTCTGSIYTMNRWKELQLSHWTVALGDIRRPLCSFAFLS